MRRIVLLFALLALSISADPYRTKLASRLTYFSAIAYESQDAIESWACPFCTGISFLHPKVVSNDSNSVYGFVGYSPEY